MQCFYHSDKAAVGICKACGKGLCVDCAVDLGKGLACRGRCEDTGRAIIQLVERNIQSITSGTKIELIPPKQLFPPDPSFQLAHHVHLTRRFNRGLGIFFLVLGIVLLLVGVVQQIGLVGIIGGCFIAPGAFILFLDKRNFGHVFVQKTQTK